MAPRSAPRAESLLIGIETTLTECDLQITMCVAYKNKIQNRLIALVIKCVISHIDCILNESVNGTGWVWTDFVIQIPRALGLGMTKCSIS